MTKQVSLSNDAYARLRAAKQEGESFSQVVQRLLMESRQSRKDPMRFARFPHRFTMSMEEHLQQVEEDRDTDDRDAWHDAGP